MRIECELRQDATIVLRHEVDAVYLDIVCSHESGGELTIRVGHDQLQRLGLLLRECGYPFDVNLTDNDCAVSDSV